MRRRPPRFPKRTGRHVAAECELCRAFPRAEATTPDAINTLLRRVREHVIDTRHEMHVEDTRFTLYSPPENPTDAPHQ